MKSLAMSCGANIHDKLELLLLQRIMSSNAIVCIFECKRAKILREMHRNSRIGTGMRVNTFFDAYSDMNPRIKLLLKGLRLYFS